MIIRSSEPLWAHDLLLLSLFCLFCFVMVLLDPMWEVGRGELQLMPCPRTWRYTSLQPAPDPQATGLAGRSQVPLTLVLFRETSFGNTESQNISLARTPGSNCFGPIKSLKPNFFLWPLIINMTHSCPLGEKDIYNEIQLREIPHVNVGQPPFLVSLFYSGLEKHNQDFKRIL